jgi:hypothetical protein
MQVRALLLLGSDFLGERLVEVQTGVDLPRLNALLLELLSR